MTDPDDALRAVIDELGDAFNCGREGVWYPIQRRAENLLDVLAPHAVALAATGDGDVEQAVREARRQCAAELRDVVSRYAGSGMAIPRRFLTLADKWGVPGD